MVDIISQSLRSQAEKYTGGKTFSAMHVHGDEVGVRHGRLKTDLN